MIKNQFLADTVTAIGTLDVVFGEMIVNVNHESDIRNDYGYANPVTYAYVCIMYIS